MPVGAAEEAARAMATAPMGEQNVTGEGEGEGKGLPQVEELLCLVIGGGEWAEGCQGV